MTVSQLCISQHLWADSRTVYFRGKLLLYRDRKSTGYPMFRQVTYGHLLPIGRHTLATIPSMHAYLESVPLNSNGAIFCRICEHSLLQRHYISTYCNRPIQKCSLTCTLKELKTVPKRKKVRLERSSKFQSTAQYNICLHDQLLV